MRNPGVLLVAFNALVLLSIFYFSSRASTCAEVPTPTLSPTPTPIQTKPKLTDEEFLRLHPTQYMNVVSRYGKTHNVFIDHWTKDWWVNTFPAWENTTFLYFNTFIRPTTSYIGSGEWIGPTLMFAAQKAWKLLGVEPDPSAYEVLKKNVDSNPSFSHKISLSKLCISNKAETLTMYGLGGSGSFLDKLGNVEGQQEYKSGNPGMKFTVHCLPMSAFIEDHYAVTEDMFIKLDTEGAEQVIIPSMYPWLSNFTKTYKMDYKPAFFFSFHTPNKFTPEIIDDIVQVIHLYKWMSIVNGPKIVFDKANTLTREKLMSYSWVDIYITDREPSEYGL